MLSITMWLLPLVLLMNETFGLQIQTHFEERADKTIRPVGFDGFCLTLVNHRRLIVKFAPCNEPVNEKQMWIVTKGNYFGRQYRSRYAFTHPKYGLNENKNMCLTINRRNQGKKLERCKNLRTRGARPIQLFDMLGDEDQLSVPTLDGSKRQCLTVDTQNGRVGFGHCDTTSCNTGRDVNFKCSSCGWRYGFENKCDYCANKNHVLTNTGDCIDMNSVTTCTEKYPIGFTMKYLQWYHLQGYNYCIACDPIDPSKCRENFCPQRYGTGISVDGKCQCPEGSARLTPQSGGPYVGYAACANSLPGNTWADMYIGQNPDCTNNEFQTAPESKCNKCVWYNQFTCASCKTKGATIAYTNPGSRMYCVCPEGTTYNASDDRCAS